MPFYQGAAFFGGGGAELGLRCCAQAFSSCGERASHCSGFSCGARALGTRASVAVARGL